MRPTDVARAAAPVAREWPQVRREGRAIRGAMPAARLPGCGPLRRTRDPPEEPAGGSPREHADDNPRERSRQVFRIPDFQIPTHASRAPPTPHERGNMTPGRLGTWKPVNLKICRVARPAQAQSGRRAARTDPERTCLSAGPGLLLLHRSRQDCGMTFAIRRSRISTPRLISAGTTIACTRR